ncbi:MAG: hypothetical protein M1826_001902 [Phylliscum demangeonii]|nr:MAG: hypothetical protein M1826_001902 [Phylliscum demangeonii]
MLGSSEWSMRASRSGEPATCMSQVAARHRPRQRRQLGGVRREAGLRQHRFQRGRVPDAQRCVRTEGGEGEHGGERVDGPGGDPPEEDAVVERVEVARDEEVVGRR